MQVLEDGSYIIDDRIDLPGEGGGPFVFCRGWLLEVVEIEAGEYFFFSNGREVRPAGGRYAAFYPPFSIVRTFVRDVKGTVAGVGSLDVPEGLPSGPIIFETDFTGPFTSAAEAVEVIANGRGHHSIEACSNPSLLSKRAKRLIDENYLAFPSIGRISDRLNVSHAHMTRQFKRDFEMTPSDYLHHLRVADATFRLSTGQPIIDISHEVGYNDLSRFYKQFRKNTNTSPAHCREMLDR